MVLCFINIDGKEVDHAKLASVPSRGDIIITKLDDKYTVDNVVFKEDSENVTVNAQRLNQ